MTDRTATFERRTAETEVAVSLDLDGAGRAEVTTGIGFLDHLLTTFACHAKLDLTLRCRGDLKVDDHHTAEDCALALGTVVDRALGERRGIQRFGWALAPLDESLARVAIDLSGRPFAAIELGLCRDRLGALSCENIPHLLSSFAVAARATLHVDVLRGTNDHHRAEAAMKATALALRQAVAPTGEATVPSVKETLTAGGI